MVRPLVDTDIEAILNIYNYYVTNTVATFDIAPIDYNTYVAKVKSITANYPFFVFEVHNEILGFAYASQFRPKPAYDFAVEATVYVAHNAHGKHIGSALYDVLLGKLKTTNIRSVLGVLTLPNTPSEHLHKKFGFTCVGHLKAVGYKFNQWHDVGIFQLQL